MSVESVFLNFSADKIEQLMGRIETCVAQLTPEQIWRRGGENQNAAGNLLLHLEGNVRQWILHGAGARPDIRRRDAEFAARSGATAPELLAALRSTVDEAAAIIRAVPAERILDRVRPQGYDRTILEAIYSVLEHFSGHTFQIILLTKAFTGQDLGFHAHLGGGAPHRDPLP